MTKAARLAWLISVVAIAGASGMLAFLLSISTTAQRGFLERHYVWLFWVNVAVATALIIVIGVAGARLALRVKRGRFGSRLLLKLAGIFAFVGVVPGVLIYTVSYQFVNRSIESLFDQRLASALEAGLALGQDTLDNARSELSARTRSAAERWEDSALAPLALERLRDQLSARSVALLGGNGQVLLAAGGDADGIPDRPTSTMLSQARANGVVSRLEGLEDEQQAALGEARIRAIALLPSSALQLTNSDRYLMVVRNISGKVVSNALNVQAANQEYLQRSLLRDGLRRMYLGTLTLVLILAVFAALLLAVALSNQLVQPLLLLAEGMREVATGDLKAKPVFRSRDELGGLTRSFADMTQQLADARAQVDQSVTQLESARTHLQTILDNLTAGVLVFGADQRIESVNPGATRILRLPLSAYVGRGLEELEPLEAFAKSIWQRFELQSPESGEREHWQDSFELQLNDQTTLTLLVRGAALPHDARLVVFDDISEVVSAQRSAAWSEVARRLAHEIKNPLTPIQLSAERLQFKLESKLEGTDQAMLVRSVSTIVNQVQAMKQLVNEFRDYARLPAAKLAPLDVNELVTEVLTLYAEAQEAGRLVADLTLASPLILGDAPQLRQVIHNLVQNALDAVSERPDGRVTVRTQKALSELGELRALRLVITDNGPGFAEKVLNRAFEPYVTTKAKGTGLGLAVVKKIADEHGARIRLINLHPAGDADQAPIGAQVSLSFSKLATAPSLAPDAPRPA
ncbi:Signal transduction histidine kinase involved in nitrogen fixation and metabolism regulation [Roseateles sp. YR242]|uniref:sensor histidine kinase n=1 Tax=Roseateles sp. YR242 TaxID=1855305 RepID=UPI0008BC9C2F|nr:ATP-binding protein [Roseateles sp. YR242]SEL31956.1 Signal transduction histidine kinase involved in nitrogen fixation and metabolism regulation [Roseateles sp. YR242]